ncbi:thiamine-phosphate kinase [Polaribacter reichenbachii]|uniref:Thiamine-monophosphate kinase n=1 Tax=Polaribacter reichenbachii TaxID=996801 RepID=A0A1B8TUH9_9FLAO|nr:thiamine-phosphate kinase [Polaribacter reichenbachii]APZ45788.1 thiamine-phosphate kinase [Polaribacter reichenbachii]AUC19650.1 thiamine-phosphate kinase [Polaribacter reichenbachii]OBY63194.1 thiamine-monophosphate kinase [Polaribacter reichenbachii]
MLEDKNQQKTSLAELGEFGLINHITKYFKVENASTLKAIGDDAAVLDASEKQTLVTTDLLIEGVHFDLSYMPLKHLGYKAVMVNLSDVYAMNGTAEQITVSIAVSNRFPLEAIEELYAGIQLACDTYKVDLIGGDTTSSTKGILISVTAIGKAEKEDVVYRNGAKETDLIVVSGDLGAAYLGLQVLEREKQVFKVDPNNQPDLDNYTYLIERQLKPEARKDIAGLLKELEVKPTAMIDISDGLSSELFHICTQSKVGCKIYEDKLPLDPQVISTCEEFELDSTMVALSGGEDYELLFTVPIADFDKVKANPNFSIIGHVTAENQGLQLITRANQEIELKAQGWNSLKSE